MNRVLLGDCLEVMPELPDNSFDMILCDLPYGTTACSWDEIIPFEPLWANYNRLIKKGGAIVLFGNEPFSSRLVSSNLKGFKYKWTWDKVIPSGMTYAKHRPMQQTEDICIFSKEGVKTSYYPQMVKRDKPIKAGGNNVNQRAFAVVGVGAKEFKKTYDYKNPTTLISFMKIRSGGLHPTQKPVALFEYLIKTYSQEGDNILDNCAGSGTTGEACQNLNRNFTLIERDLNYYNIIKRRLNFYSKESLLDFLT